MGKSWRHLARTISLTLTASLLISGLSLFAITTAQAATAGSGICQQTYTLTAGSESVTVTSADNYCYVSFKNLGAASSTSSSYVWSKPAGVSSLDVLVIGGGGGGGARQGGGGGGGSFVQATSYSVASSATNISVVVGSGGAGANPSISYIGTKGNDSSFKIGANGLTALGGGAGIQSSLSSADDGGSGGGAGGGQNGGSPTTSTQKSLDGLSTLKGIEFGQNGAPGVTEPSVLYDFWAAGGGGGAGGAGKRPSLDGIERTTDFPDSNGSLARGGDGGIGKVSSFISTTIATNLGIGQNSSGSAYFAAGGGGGIGADGAAGGVGGIGGGGNGTRAIASGGVAALTSTGSGGGGSGYDDISPVAGDIQNPPGGPGGSGVVVIRYTILVSEFSASNYTAGSTTWANSIPGATAGTAPTGGMTKTSSGPTGVVFAGKESSNSDQISSSIGSTTSLDTVTVEMWLRLKDAGNEQNAFGSMLFSWNTSPNNYNIYHFGNQVGFNNFASQLYGVDSTGYNNVWTHFVFVMTDTGPWASQKIYVNGVLQASTCRVTINNCGDAQARSFASNGNFLLMDHPNASNTWNAKGDLGLVRIYNQELSAASVLSAYNLTSPDYAEAPDTTAPTFNSSSTFSVNENIATSATAATIRVSESATVTISSGADAARFNITRSETDTAIIKFNVSPDFEAPADVGGNNVYDLTLTATDAASNAGTQSITITVSDVVDTSSFNSLALAGSATTATFRTAVVITANVTVASRVTFRVNGKVLPGCKNKLATGSSSSFAATCSWRPSNRGVVSLTAAATPTGAGISSTTSNPISIMVGQRVGAR
jgi:hypothetical protein